MKNTWTELDLKILRSNVRNLKNALRTGAEIIFVVKADAYGHGILPTAKCAWESGVKWFAVAHLDEAVPLREMLPDAGILIVGAVRPNEVPTIVQNNLLPVVVSRQHAMSLAHAAATRNLTVRCHAKIDTGMGRLGFDWEKAPEQLARLSCEPGLNIRGICSHFATADEPERTFADTQAERFKTVLEACKKDKVPISLKHISNSGGILCDPAWDIDAVRPGILLYGYGQTHRPGEPRVATNPFLQWKTRLLQIKKVPKGFPVSYGRTHVTEKETHIGTIDAGYADGYPRALSNKGHVIVRKRRRPVVGRVTMNLVMIDLGPEPDAEENDEVILIGGDEKEAIWADEIATWCDTISYEILTNIRTTDRRIKSA